MRRIGDFFRRYRRPIIVVTTLVLLIVVIRSISVPDVVSLIRTIDLRFIGLAFLLNLLMIGMMASRWYILYRLYPQQRPAFRSLLSATFVAAFFNNFLPSTVGGDSYRMYHTSRQVTEHGLSGAFSVVFVDRITGLIGLLLIGLVAVLFTGDIGSAMIDLRLWVLVVTGLLMGLLVFSLQPTGYALAIRLLHVLHIPRRDWVQAQIEKVQSHLGRYTAHPALIVQALILSVCLRLIWLLGCYCVGLSLHLELALLPYLAFIPLIEIIRMIPLTIQGLGVREGLFAVFFGFVGLGTSEATLLSVIIYVLLNLNGIIGGVIYLFAARR